MRITVRTQTFDPLAVLATDGKLGGTIYYVAGTSHDVSHLIDFLPSYLFPNGERTIAQFVCVGKSMGGHSTWLVLRNGTLTCTLSKLGSEGGTLLIVRLDPQNRESTLPSR